MDFLSDVHCKPLAIFSTLRLFIPIDPPADKNITMRKIPVNHLLKCTYYSCKSVCNKFTYLSFPILAQMRFRE